MGATVSAGVDNDELVDNLLEADYIKTLAVEKVFRAVDRGHYFTLESRDNAYKDLAWKYGNVHISAPCIYSEVMENLQLAPGMSFLNLGSGTGYLSTMAGLILGANGINHGVEIHEDVLEYAKQKLDEFCNTSPAIDEYEFCQPKFVAGNCLNLGVDNRQYDRVYCGAACPEIHENYMKNLIKVGGILVMPINNQLLQIYRISEELWETRTVLPVSFASLIPNSPDNIETVHLPDAEPLSLQEICRFAIRAILRQKINQENPEVRSDAAHESKVRIKKRTLRKFVIPIFGNNAENQSDITPEDLNGLRDFGRRGFLMDVQSVRSCRTLLELLPGPSNRMLTSGEEGDVEGEYEDYDEDDYEDLDDYEGLDEDDVDDLGTYDENDEDNESDDEDDNDDNNDNDDNDDNDDSATATETATATATATAAVADDDIDVDVDLDVDDNDDNDNDSDNNDDNDSDNNDDNDEEGAEVIDVSAEGDTQENEVDDVARAVQGLDDPEEERGGVDDYEMMETDMVPMTRSRARKSSSISPKISTRSSTKKRRINIGNRGSTKSSTGNCAKISNKISAKYGTKNTTKGCTPSSSKMVTRSSARNAKTSPAMSTNSPGTSRMTTRSSARKGAKNTARDSAMITRSAANRRSSPRALARINTSVTNRMSTMMSSMMGNRMALRLGSRVGTRMGTRMGSRMRRVDYSRRLDDSLGRRFLRHITLGEDPDEEPERYVEHIDPDEKILVRFEDSDTESYMNDTPEKLEAPTNYSTLMREKIKLLPLPTSMKYYINFNRDL